MVGDGFNPPVALGVDDEDVARGRAAEDRRVVIGDGNAREGAHLLVRLDRRRPHLRRGEVGRAEVGWAEVGWAEVGWAEVGWGEVGWDEVGRDEVGWAEVGRAEQTSRRRPMECCRVPLAPTQRCIPHARLHPTMHPTRTAPPNNASHTQRKGPLQCQRQRDAAATSQDALRRRRAAAVAAGQWLRCNTTRRAAAARAAATTTDGACVLCTVQCAPRVSVCVCPCAWERAWPSYAPCGSSRRSPTGGAA
jgi:hypothetical protein